MSVVDVSLFVTVLLASAVQALWTDVDKPFCGYRRQDFDDDEFRIQGGDTVEKGSWPWMAEISYWNGTAYMTHCGGTLIYPNYVITAKHCVDVEGELRVRLGLHDVNNPDGSTQTFNVTNIAAVPFGNRAVNKDLALIRLDRLAQFSAGWAVFPACFPKTSRRAIQLLQDSDTQCYLLGWGINNQIKRTRPDQLQQMKVGVFCSRFCEQPGYPFESRHHLCAGQPPAKRQGSCEGDSGGGLMCRSVGDDRWRFVAVYSRGFDTCSPLGIYMRVTQRVKSWIKTTVKQLEAERGGYEAVRYCGDDVGGCKSYSWKDIYN